MIKCENIFKSFDGRTVLNDISVTFDTGKTNLIIGRSGSGKTVLLKTLVGLHEPDSGEIFFDDICTIQELEALAQRLEVACLLNEGKSYIDINKATGASTATICRVSKCLNYGEGGYATAIERLENNDI